MACTLVKTVRGLKIKPRWILSQSKKNIGINILKTEHFVCTECAQDMHGACTGNLWGVQEKIGGKDENAPQFLLNFSG